VKKPFTPNSMKARYSSSGGRIKPSGFSDWNGASSPSV
jgi:hypothetical protein